MEEQEIEYWFSTESGAHVPVKKGQTNAWQKFANLQEFDINQNNAKPKGKAFFYSNIEGTTTTRQRRAFLYTTPKKARRRGKRRKDCFVWFEPPTGTSRAFAIRREFPEGQKTIVKKRKE